MFRRGNKGKMKFFASLLALVFLFTSFTPAFIPGLALGTRNIAYAQTTDGVWLSGDHHMHTTASDGSHDVVYDVVYAKQHGLDFIAITNHGGKTNEPKIYAEYEQIVNQRVYNSNLLIFHGFEWNVPAGEHATFLVAQGSGEKDQVRDFMTKYDQSYNPEANSQEKAIEGLQYAERMNPKPLVLLNHPSRRGKYSLAEIKAYDEAGTVAAGFEGAPGHQANPTRGSYPGIEPGSSRTYGGYDKMTAEVGGLWDTLLSEGRKWFITANSDFHKHYTENGDDFWPGQYSKTYVWAKEKSYAAVLDSLRNGRSYTVQGDLINALELTAEVQGKKAGLGETLFCSQSGDVKVTIKVRDPQTLNNHGDNPAVKQVQLISNTGGSPEITRVFTAADWQKQGDWLVMEHTFPKVTRDFYVRARGSNTEETNPAEDPQNEDAWQDLWFYSNPIFTSTQSAKNVVLLIGDGMGFEQMEAYRDQSPGKYIYMDEVNDAAGKMTTHSADAPITDSAAAATAMSTGYKTLNRMLGMTPDNDEFLPDEVPHILELAELKGLATGLVATSQICHATPAGFAAHVSHRNQFNKIASQYLDNFAAKGYPIEVLLGGEKRNFTSPGRPEYYNEAGKKVNDVNDNRDLVGEFQDKGYLAVENTTQLSAAGADRLLGLFTEKGGLTPEHQRQAGNLEPHLYETTQKALETLAKDPDGFFVMIEGSQIDWAGHANDVPYLLGEMQGFDLAIKATLDFQKNHPDTLIIVTADHECGGLNYENGQYTWGSKDHTAAPVPVLAEGPGASLFSDTIDNTDLPRKIAEVLALDQPLVLQHTTATANQPATFKVTSFSFPVAGALVSVIGGAGNVLATLTTNAQGEVSYKFSQEGNYRVKTVKDGYRSQEVALQVGSTPAAVATITDLFVQDSQHQPAGTVLSKGKPHYLSLKAKYNTPGSINGLTILEVLGGSMPSFLNAARLTIPETPPAEFTALYQPATAGNYLVKSFLWNDWSTSAAWRSLAEPKELTISVN